MSVEIPDQVEPVIENRADLFASIVWFNFLQELVRQHNTLQATVAEQQTQIEDLTSRVEALESLHP